MKAADYHSAKFGCLQMSGMEQTSILFMQAAQVSCASDHVAVPVIELSNVSL